MSMSNNTTTKLSQEVIHHQNTINSSLASLFHCIEDILNGSSRKCHDTLTMAALSFTKLAAITTA